MSLMFCIQREAIREGGSGAQGLTSHGPFIPLEVFWVTASLKRQHRPVHSPWTWPAVGAGHTPGSECGPNHVFAHWKRSPLCLLIHFSSASFPVKEIILFVQFSARLCVITSKLHIWFFFLHILTPWKLRRSLKFNEIQCSHSPGVYIITNLFLTLFWDLLFFTSYRRFVISPPSPEGWASYRAFTEPGSRVPKGTSSWTLRMFLDIFSSQNTSRPVEQMQWPQSYFFVWLKSHLFFGAQAIRKSNISALPHFPTSRHLAKLCVSQGERTTLISVDVRKLVSELVHVNKNQFISL